MAGQAEVDAQKARENDLAQQEENALQNDMGNDTVIGQEYNFRHTAEQREARIARHNALFQNQRHQNA